jgi:hypothetical protein
MRQCPLSARSVPAQCPSQCPSQCPTVKTHGFSMVLWSKKNLLKAYISSKNEHCKNCVFLHSGTVTGTVTGTVRALCGQCAGTADTALLAERREAGLYEMGNPMSLQLACVRPGALLFIKKKLNIPPPTSVPPMSPRPGAGSSSGITEREG